MRLFFALSILLIAVEPALAQGIMESGATRALSAGMGAGLAGSLGHGRVVRQAYEASVDAQKAIVQQSQAIKDYYARGTKFEDAKQWNYAEVAYKYVLSLISHRDGPGSPKSLPVLTHLAKISKAQNKIDAAISYQKSVVAISQADKKPDANLILSAQRELSGLFIQKKDYRGARLSLQAETALFDRFPALPPEQKNVTLSVYGTVLQQLDGGGSNQPALTSQPVPPQSGEAIRELDPTMATERPLVVHAGQLAPGQNQPLTSHTATPAVQTNALPQQPTLTPEQRALHDAHLFGADPLPSEVEMRNELSGGTQQPPAAEQPQAHNSQ
jgi:hypothetical protein